MQRSNSWFSSMTSMAVAVGRAIGVVESGPILPVWTPPPSPTHDGDEPFCRAEEMIRATAGRIETDKGARWVNVIETGTAPRSVFVSMRRVGRVQ